MIVDFHVHTRGSRDSGMDPMRIIEVARRAGLDAIAVCDHNSIAVAQELAAGIPEATRDGVPGLLVIVGEEIRTAEGEIIGYFLSEAIPKGLTPEETVDRIVEQGGVVSVPHPFDRFRHSPLTRSALERIAPRLHAVEGLNARNLAYADDAAARDWASSRGLSCLAGSDAHTYREVGRACTELPAFDSAATLLGALPHARLVGSHSNPAVHLVTAVRKRLPQRANGRMKGRGE